MNRILAALALLASSGADAQQQADPERGLCQALESVVRQARRTRLAQEMFLGQDEAWSIFCGHRSHNAVQSAFCSVAINRVGLEFVHSFPWLVHDCLTSRGINPAVETADRYSGLSGRGRLTHLEGCWPGGIRIEIRYTAFPDEAGIDDEFAGYRGRYDVTVAKVP